jgi:hypothetical protein
MAAIENSMPILAASGHRQHPSCSSVLVEGVEVSAVPRLHHISEAIDVHEFFALEDSTGKVGVRSFRVQRTDNRHWCIGLALGVLVPLCFAILILLLAAERSVVSSTDSPANPLKYIDHSGEITGIPSAAGTNASNNVFPFTSNHNHKHSSEAAILGEASQIAFPSTNFSVHADVVDERAYSTSFDNAQKVSFVSSFKTDAAPSGEAELDNHESVPKLAGIGGSQYDQLSDFNLHGSAGKVDKSRKPWYCFLVYGLAIITGITWAVLGVSRIRRRIA